MPAPCGRRHRWLSGSLQEEKRERKRRKKEKKAKKARKEKKEKERADDDEKRYSKKDVMQMFGNFLEEKGEPSALCRRP